MTDLVSDSQDAGWSVNAFHEACGRRVALAAGGQGRVVGPEALPAGGYDSSLRAWNDSEVSVAMESLEPASLRSTPGKARRAAGSVTFGDVVGALVFRRPARQPTTDTRDLQAGTTLEVSAFARRGERFRQGVLVLDLSAPETVVWRAHRLFSKRGSTIPLSRPFDVESVIPVSGAGSWRIKRLLFRMIVLRADGELWQLAVPTIDVELVRFALGVANGPASPRRSP
jgi:hypothetical protein